jgi:gliding motility-associated-like protein
MYFYKLIDAKLQCIKPYRMFVQSKRIILLLWIVYFPVKTVFPQAHVSKNNYTGAWETPTSWSPTWTNPQNNIVGYDITINGYITLNDSLSFSGSSGNLIINDTLVIMGDLFLDNNNVLRINDNGILIIRGNLHIHNHVNSFVNGYLIITGGIDKHGPIDEGSMTSNDNRVKIFIGGTITPGLTNRSNFPALNCTAPLSIPYPGSGCSFGNMTDIISDPVYLFFQSTCPPPNAGPDQEITSVYETKMKAVLSSSASGEWSLISGSGHISDIHSPTTLITGLADGENIFLWKVRNGNCETSARVKITVLDIFVPTVITPNGDGKNDYFKISKNIGRVELIILNRWGNEEYINSDYKNDWDGRNNKGAELPFDTYFYVLKFENGKIIRGSVLIKR